MNRLSLVSFLTLLGKELRSSFVRPSTFLIVGMVLFVQGILFYYYATNIGPEYSAVLLETFFEIATPMTIFGSVFISIRTLSDEYKQGSIRLLQASPVSDAHIVIAKAIALCTICWFMTILSAYLPIYIYKKGQVSLGHILAGYSGLCLVAMTSVSLSIWCSSLTDKQFVAGAVAGAIVSLSYLMHRFTGLMGNTLGSTVQTLSFKSHLRAQYGLIILSDVGYYVLVGVVFLSLAIFSLRQKRINH